MAIQIRDTTKRFHTSDTKTTEMAIKVISQTFLPQLKAMHNILQREQVIETHMDKGGI